MTEIQKYEEISVTVPQLIEKGKVRVEKATQAGETLLATMEQMSDQLDSQAESFLVKARKTYDLMMNERKPITQFLDSIKKEFTALEKELDPKNQESVVSKIRLKRDQWATFKLEEQKRKEEEARKKQALIQEKATVKEQVEIALGNYFNEYMSQCVTHLYDTFNDSTLENITEVDKYIKKCSDVYPMSHFEQFKVSVSTIYLSKDDKVDIKVQVTDGKYFEFKDIFQNKIMETKLDLTSKLPSKKAELEQLAQADAAERERLKEEAEKRKQEEKERLAKEKKEADDRVKAEAEANKTASAMQTMFDQEEVSRQNRTGFEITVKHPAGFGLIFQFWYEREGKHLAIDEIEKKNLKQMKTFCEKYAHKNEEVIKSPYIEYKEIAKVAARK